MGAGKNYRRYPSPKRKFQQDKYRVIEWEQKTKNGKPVLSEEQKLTKEDFMKKWRNENEHTVDEAEDLQSDAEKAGDQKNQ